MVWKGYLSAFLSEPLDKGSRRQEPWTFGEPYESVCRKMIQLRQRLLPYLDTLFEECHTTGAPILRPLLFEYPDDETTYSMNDEFLLGNALLIATITRLGIEHRLTERLVVSSNFWRLLEDLGQSLSSSSGGLYWWVALRSHLGVEI